MPATDYGVQQGFALTFGRNEPPKPRELIEIAEAGRPHRTTAAWYFWRALDLPEEKARLLVGESGRGTI